MHDQAGDGQSGFRDLAKSAAGFSWALSLFGAHQAMDLLNPGSKSQDSTGAAGGFDALTDAMIEQMSGPLRQTFDTGDQIQQQLIDAMLFFLPGSGQRAPTLGLPIPQPPSAPLYPDGQRPTGPPPVHPSGSRPATGPHGSGPSSQRSPPSALDSPLFSANTTANEEVLVVYTRGQGRFNANKSFIALDNIMYDVGQRPIGRHQGVWQALFEDPSELLARHAPPVGPMNEPVGPVPRGMVAANTKAIWEFDDSSSIVTVGPAASHLIPLADGSFLFLVSTAQVVTHGTGRYQGIYGLSQSLGATHIAAGVDLFSSDVETFPATTIDSFKVRRVGRRVSVPVPANPANPPSPASFGEGTSRFAEVLGSQMHYREQGVGEPILFLHGNPTSSYLWRNILPLVSSHGRCLAPDLIGMGLSDKPEIGYGFFDQVKYLEALIDRLDLRDITLVMHDWGSALGFHYAARNPGNVRGMMFMEAMLRPYERWEDFPAGLRDTFRRFRTPNAGYEEIVVKNVFVEQLLPASMLRTLSPAEMDAYRQPFLEPLQRRPIWAFANDIPIAGEPEDVVIAVKNYSRWLQQTSIPKLLLHAEPGAITSAADVEWCQANLQNLETVLLGPGAHFLQEDHPDRIAREFTEWYARMGVHQVRRAS